MSASLELDDDEVEEVPLTTCLRPPVFDHLFLKRMKIQSVNQQFSRHKSWINRSSSIIKWFMHPTKKNKFSSIIPESQAFDLRRLIASDNLQTSPSPTTRTTPPASAFRRSGPAPSDPASGHSAEGMELVVLSSCDHLQNFSQCQHSAGLRWTGRLWSGAFSIWDWPSGCCIYVYLCDMFVPHMINCGPCPARQWKERTMTVAFLSFTERQLLNGTLPVFPSIIILSQTVGYDFMEIKCAIQCHISSLQYFFFPHLSPIIPTYPHLPIPTFLSPLIYPTYVVFSAVAFADTQLDDPESDHLQARYM